jgi:hypothetical protein
MAKPSEYGGLRCRFNLDKDKCSFAETQGKAAARDTAGESVPRVVVSATSGVTPLREPSSLPLAVLIRCPNEFASSISSMQTWRTPGLRHPVNLNRDEKV